jgi:DNA-binding CsgD family transcriptional regulator
MRTASSRPRTGPLPLLTQAEVDEARMLRNEHGLTLQKLAILYSISIKTMSYYINNPKKKGRSSL